MRVYGPGTVQLSSVRRSERRASAGAFAGLVSTDDVSSVHGAAPSQSIASVGAIVALQQTDDALHARKRGEQRATDLLSELEEIRRAMILGALPPQRLQAIAARLAAKDSSQLDPVLQQILQDIELRVAVELAKFGLRQVA
jgi:hypothetical protein